MSDNEYWDEATERAYWDACAQEEAVMREKDNELIPRGEARILAYEIFNHFMYADFLEIKPADIYKKVDAIPAVPHEMTAREYLKAVQRLCNSHPLGECRSCPLFNYDCPISSNGVADELVDTVAIVEAWAREHPERSEE